MKRITCAGLTVLMLIILSSTATHAAPENFNVRGVIAPQFTHISFLDSQLSVNTSGRATCGGSVTLYNPLQTAELTIILQKSTADGWVDVMEWNDSGPGVPGVNIQRQYYVVKGTYRVCAVAKAYSASGTVLETVTAYSVTGVY